MSHLGMVSIRRFWNSILEEPIPDCFDALLKRLPDGSDGSGAGEAKRGLTRSGSEPSDRTSLSIHAALASTPHNHASDAPHSKGTSHQRIDSRRVP
jgi:hypothetical protein